MKIDAHQHFWNYNLEEFGWIDNRMDVLRRNYLPEDLSVELDKSGYSGSVVVQARQTKGETGWLLDLAEKFDFIKGVVGWVDLCQIDELKRELDKFTRSEKFVGVRHVIHDETDDNFMLRDDFLEGISCLKEYDLTYDLLLFPKHLTVAQIVVSMFPGQKFVLDHIGKPLIKNKIIDPWKEDIIRLAENRNVWCKLSGMVTEADWRKIETGDFNPYLDVVYKSFGPERLMTGSDWPVCLLAGDYKKVMGIVETFISGISPEIQQKISGQNCIDFYGLDVR